MDEWSGREKRTVTVQLVVIVILLIIVGTLQEGIRYEWEEEEDYSMTTIAWRVSVAGDNYIIAIIDVQSESLDDVSYSVLNTNRLVTSWNDPANENIRMEGDLTDVNFTQANYDIANVTVYDKFYSQDPVRVPPVSINHTLCVVYMDVTSDGRLSSGDVIWIRSTDNDGCAEEDYRFRMVNEKVGDAYGELFLPAV